MQGIGNQWGYKRIADFGTHFFCNVCIKVGSLDKKKNTGTVEV